MLEYDRLCAGLSMPAYVLDYEQLFAGLLDEHLCDDGVRQPLSVMDYNHLCAGLQPPLCWTSTSVLPLILGTTCLCTVLEGVNNLGLMWSSSAFASEYTLFVLQFAVHMEIYLVRKR